ncbi:family 43 glycosylhydrolase [Agromyces aerolatus]|uniref:family 43 glycosylhydrolase n=1 Tax=Agromyces sp. LY-1074 TaxID=3074080 RepID=UPI002867467B|nr:MULTISPECIES: family 43 glycosylhydrolase [unclassified Agromyces]MDR5699477.1 family 43 glycosylhydrolase [Agromyces sp. LY-1074]MDR5705773.1 family 43 glycosylhydrolase [Agromyces sp. LY-1358]
MNSIDKLRETVGAQGGWRKLVNNPVLGDDEDFRFDNHVLRTEQGYRMYFSWRKHYAIAMTESEDGVNWSEPRLVVEPRPETGWEDDINRPAVVYRDGTYHMWYSGQTAGRTFASETWTEAYLEASSNTLGTSAIGYATSSDGISWTRRDTPVLSAAPEWEQQSLMCPTVFWSEDEGVYKMWYSGGGWFEPNAIGHAVSPDGITWTRVSDAPVFGPNPNELWERERIAGAHVMVHDGWHYLFYIGYEDMFKARIGLARSRDGISGWERHPANPILSAGIPGAWDSESIYKPFVLFEEDRDRWIMWFNARKGTTERIGVAIHDGRDLGFGE